MVSVLHDLAAVLDRRPGIEIADENEYRHAAPDGRTEVVAEIGCTPRVAQQHAREVDRVAEERRPSFALDAGPALGGGPRAQVHHVLHRRLDAQPGPAQQDERRDPLEVTGRHLAIRGRQRRDGARVGERLRGDPLQVERTDGQR